MTLEWGRHCALHHALSTLVPSTFLLLLAQVAVGSWPQKKLKGHKRGDHPGLAGSLTTMLKEIFPESAMVDQEGRWWPGLGWACPEFLGNLDVYVKDWGCPSSALPPECDLFLSLAHSLVPALLAASIRLRRQCLQTVEEPRTVGVPFALHGSLNEYSFPCLGAGIAVVGIPRFLGGYLQKHLLFHLVSAEAF